MPKTSSRKGKLSGISKREDQTRRRSNRLNNTTKAVASAPAEIDTVADVEATPESDVKDDTLYFFKPEDPETGFLSQWYQCDFVDAKGVVYHTAEHYMMYQKALLFDDKETGARILEAITPKDVKALGRLVTPFDQATWDANKLKIVEEGSYLKFTSPAPKELQGTEEATPGTAAHVEELRQKLLDTGIRSFVEAAPRDRIWGIGFGKQNAPANRSRWGQNLLGKALMKARERILAGKEAGGEPVNA